MEDAFARAVAIVGVGAILPDAPSVGSFWKNITSGRYSVSEVSPDRWDPSLYFDADRTAPDKTYSKIGGWVREAEWDPVRWRLPVPPRVAQAMDDAQKWAVACAVQALADYGAPTRPVDPDRTAVILGNAMAGEKHYKTALRATFPECARLLEECASFASLPRAVRAAVEREWHDRLAATLPEITEDAMPGELANCIAGRIANLLNFRGPNFVVDAACASAMAAVRAASEGLVQHDFDLAVTGGIDRNMSPHTFVKFCKIGALSATGSRPYADGADGFVMGEGAAIFLLKRLADAEAAGDRVYAVIRGVGASSDGKGKGITAPNPIGQRLAIERAWQAAGLRPETVTMVEGHGTSTAVGDVVEVQSLVDVFGASAPRRQSVALGSVKSNLGHLKGAAGAAGLLKAALALHEKTIAPNANFDRPNPNIAFADSPFFVPTEARPWEAPAGGGPRRAGVSAFGFGGTNFHVVLEEFQPGRLAAKGRSQTGASVPERGHAAGTPPARASTSGARTTSSGPSAGAGWPPPPASKAPLRGCLVVGAESAEAVASRLRDVEAAAREGRTPAIAPPANSDLRAPERVAIDFGSPVELADKCGRAVKALASGPPAVWKALRAQGIFRGSGPTGRVAFLYTGQGSQYVNMLRALRDADPIVSSVFEEADRITTPLLGRPVSAFLFADAGDPAAVAAAEDNLRQTAITQPAVLTVDAALTKLLAAFGVVPDMVMGHSLGEYGALNAAGALSLADALEAVSARGREMTNVSLADNGRMAAVFAPIADIQRLLQAIDGYVVVANINSANQAVIGGETQAVSRAIDVFREAGFQVAPLSVSHAFHTRIVAPASRPLRRVLERLTFRPPAIPVVSNVTGEFYPGGDDWRARMLELLGDQVASPVQFTKGLETLLAAGARVFVEVGPKKALHGFAEEAFGQRADVSCLFTNHPKLDDRVAFNQTLCGLYAAGLGAGLGGARSEAAKATEDVAEGLPMSEVRFTATVFHDMQRQEPSALPVTVSAREAEIGRLLAPAVEQCFALLGGKPTATDEPVVVSGAAMGLPGGARVFDDDNPAKLLRGERLIGAIPDDVRRAMTDKRITRLVKSDSGEARFEVIEDPREAIKLAARAGGLDMTAEFGIPEDRLAALDRATQLAIGAGLDALRDAGIPLVLRYKTTTKGSRLPDRWGLPEALRDDTGVIFGSAFPGLDSIVSEVSRYHADRARRDQLELLESLRALMNGQADAAVRAAMERRIGQLRAAIERDPYLFDRRFLLRTLPMGHSQFAELIGARGPNTQVNAACATTTHAVSIAEDWIRRGRCRRVIVVTADDITTDTLLEWFGAGFLASGAAATDERVEDAALPFDRRRHGLVIGMGAAGLVVESAAALRERGVRPICEVMATVSANSAFHGTRLDVQHISGVMEHVVSEAERRWGLDRREMAGRMVFVSHETYTPARGGSASAEATALRRVFGEHADGIVVANTKGYTGHPMGAGIEDVAAVKMLETGLVPAVANYKEPDPELGPLNLSTGGEYPIEFALRLGAGFGSQIAMSLMRWVRTPDGKRRLPDSLGYQYRVADAESWQSWLQSISTSDDTKLEVVARTLRIKAPSPAGRREGGGSVGPGPDREKAPAPAEQAAGLAAPEPGTPRLAAPVPSRVDCPLAGDPDGAAPVSAPAQVGSEGSGAAPTSAFAPPTRDEITQALLSLVVDKTGYPVEMLDLDLDLEADLGIDTVKQAELMAAIRGKYSIPRDDKLKLRDFPTLAHVIRFVDERLPKTVEPATAKADAPAAVPPIESTGATPMAATRAAAPPAAAPPTHDEITQALLSLVVDKTGYPIEMLDLDLDLEADLGVDTVKQAELMASIRAKYDIPRDDKLKLRDFPTLAHVIRFVEQRLPKGTPPDDGGAPSPKPRPEGEARDSGAGAPGAGPTTTGIAAREAAPAGMAHAAAEGAGKSVPMAIAEHPSPAFPTPAPPPAVDAAAETLPEPPRPRWVTPRSFDEASLIPRRVPSPVLRPPLSLCKSTGVSLRSGKRVVVMCDEGGAGSVLVGLLRDLGVQCLLIGGAPDAVELGARIHGWLAAGPIHGVYWLPALDAEGEWQQLTPATWQEAVYRRIKLLGVTMRALYDQVSRPGTFLVAATRMGGHHGYDAAGALSPLGGGVSGFAKAYARERPDALVKVVDFSPDAPLETIAARLIDETLKDPAAVEIGYRSGERWAISLADSSGAAAVTPLSLDNTSVFVITGAAGSIVSAITADLAAASGGTFYLLDRVPKPDAHDPDLARVLADRDGLKRDLLERAKAAGQRVTPAMIERRLAELEREQAAAAAIESIETVGGRAVYLTVDLTDPAAVAGALETVRAKSGRVDVLVHAAGIEVSRSLCNKAQPEFDLVFDVKATGFFNLLHGAGDMPIRAVVLFSSVAARFGNAGQTDYSAANDVLCKAASNFRSTRPGTRAIAIDWTAWRDIGMASRGSIPMLLQQAGIEMLPPDVGIPIVRQHLAEGWAPGEVVVAGRLGMMMAEGDVTGGLDLETVQAAVGVDRGPMIGRVVEMSVHRGLVVETGLDPMAQPFLHDHQIDGVPVLPGAMGVEAFGELATLVAPDWRVAAVEDVRFLAPFKFYKGEPRAAVLQAVFRPEGDAIVADCRLIGRRALAGHSDVHETTHFTGRVRLQRHVRQAERMRVPRTDGAVRVEAPEVYSVYFHGPAYRVLDHAWRADRTVVGRMTGTLPPNHVPSERDTVVAPRLIELAFQAAGVWDLGVNGRLSLPHAVDRVVPYTAAEPSGRVLVALARPSARDNAFDVDVVDELGLVYLSVRGYRVVQLPSVPDGALLEPFRRAMRPGARETEPVAGAASAMVTTGDLVAVHAGNA